jgi:polyisoprenoid-binding protein YceI
MRAFPRLAILLLLVLPSPYLEAANWPPDPSVAPPAGQFRLDQARSSVIAKVRYLGLLEYAMRFKRVDGWLDVDPARPGEARLSVSVDARSFDDAGDAATREVASDILDADRRPRITFDAFATGLTGRGAVSLPGRLTFRGLTKPVTFRVTAVQSNAPADGGLAYCATTVIRRSDFGSKSWAGLVGDRIELVIAASFVRSRSETDPSPRAPG